MIPFGALSCCSAMTVSRSGITTVINDRHTMATLGYVPTSSAADPPAPTTPGTDFLGNLWGTPWTLSETDRINLDIRGILDVNTVDWGVEVTLVELKDIQLPDSMKRAMARQAEAEREKRAKIINAEGESLAAAALDDASDIMMAHPLALQLRNLQSLVEIGVDKNTTVVFPAPLMSTIGELGSFLAREAAASSPPVPVTADSKPMRVAVAATNGVPEPH
jgi:SPFH domain / Band 7 family